MSAERVLVGIDAEAASQQAVDWVIDRARGHELAITLVTAFDLLVSDSHADELRLAATAQRIRSRVPDAVVETALIERSIVEGLIDLSASFDVLVLGGHPQHRVLSVLSGSLPYRVASRSRCATVVVPDGWVPSPGPVVVGIGDDATANRAMLFAARDAIERDRELEVVHSWQLPAATDTLVSAVPGSGELRRAHRELLSTAMERVRAAFPTVRVRGFLHEGPPGDTLLSHTQHAALIVLGTHHRGALTGALLGSTGRVVLSQGEAPVCIVPPAQPVGWSASAADPVAATSPASGT
jgi:nucleotide-binding universal stress UspA family protein